MIAYRINQSIKTFSVREKVLMASAVATPIGAENGEPFSMMRQEAVWSRGVENFPLDLGVQMEKPTT